MNPYNDFLRNLANSMRDNVAALHQVGHVNPVEDHDVAPNGNNLALENPLDDQEPADVNNAAMEIINHELQAAALNDEDEVENIPYGQMALMVNNEVEIENPPVDQPPADFDITSEEREIIRRKLQAGVLNDEGEVEAISPVLMRVINNHLAGMAPLEELNFKFNCPCGREFKSKDGYAGCRACKKWLWGEQIRDPQNTF